MSNNECIATHPEKSQDTGRDWPEFTSLYDDPAATPLANALVQQFQSVEMPSSGALVKAIATGNLPDVPGLQDLPASLLAIIKTFELKITVLERQNALLREFFDRFQGGHPENSRSETPGGAELTD